MFRVCFRWAALALAAFCCLAARPARALVFVATDNEDFHTQAPPDEGLDGGWALQGQWGAFLGTPIGPRHFVTAAHVGGRLGEVFVFAGEDFVATTALLDEASDLRVWGVDRAFPRWAPLYEGRNELGRTLRIFGRGLIRGERVETASPFQLLKGWRFASGGQRMRWGENRVSAIIDHTRTPIDLGGRAIASDLLAGAFDRPGLAAEAGMASGDSGGGAFVFQNGRWRLAGIAAGVSGRYNTTNEGQGFAAAIFDEGGLFKGSAGNWRLIPDERADQPGLSLWSRVSDSVAWLRSAMDEPAVGIPSVARSDRVEGSYRDEPGARVDVARREIAVPTGGERAFFRLVGGSEFRIAEISIVGDEAVLRYGTVD